MVRSIVYVVSSDNDFTAKTKNWVESNGATVKVFTPEQWEGCFIDPAQKAAGKTFPVGHTTASGKVLQFPTPNGDTGVARMNDIECKAIENAITVYNGNLTEAAKALGIGRATLYRKVKLYNLDPSKARRKKPIAA